MAQSTGHLANTALLQHEAAGGKMRKAAGRAFPRQKYFMLSTPQPAGILCQAESPGAGERGGGWRLDVDLEGLM